jgi:bacteriocin-like protein
MDQSEETRDESVDKDDLPAETLSDEELNTVAGGFNPQPDPPGRA